jgi:hypothetical protein
MSWSSSGLCLMRIAGCWSASKRGATGLDFALLLKHYSRDGRLPRGRADLTDDGLELGSPVRSASRPRSWACTSGLAALSSTTAARSAPWPPRSFQRKKTTIGLLGLVVVAMLVGVRLGMSLAANTQAATGPRTWSPSGRKPMAWPVIGP